MEFCRCGEQWVNKYAQHCPKCHRTFLGIASYAAHLDLAGDSCHQPETVGLLLTKDGLWHDR